MGDLVDDWGQEHNPDLYREPLDAACTFAAKHPGTLFCYGNHDISYVWEEWETGYSEDARDTVLQGLEKLRYGAILPHFGPGPRMAAR